MQLKGRLSSYCVNIREVLCCTCTIAMHLFLGRSVYKHVCTVLSPSRFLWKNCFVLSTLSVYEPLRGLYQHFSIVCTGVGGERMGITIVLSHSHCTKESLRLLIIPSPHPPSVSSLAVRLSVWHSCCLSVAVAVRVRRGNDRPLPESLLLRSDRWTVCDGA